MDGRDGQDYVSLSFHPAHPVHPCSNAPMPGLRFSTRQLITPDPRSGYNFQNATTRFIKASWFSLRSRQPLPVPLTIDPVGIA